MKPRSSIPPCPPQKSKHVKSDSNKTLVRTICEETGTPIREVRLWLNILTVAIAKHLISGRPFNLYQIGRFEFGVRKGRTVIYPPGATHKAPFRSVQPDSKIIKFKASQGLKDALNNRVQKTKKPKTHDH